MHASLSQRNVEGLGSRNETSPWVDTNAHDGAKTGFHSSFAGWLVGRATLADRPDRDFFTTSIIAARV